MCKGNAYVKFELNPVYMVLFARFFLGTVKDRRGGEDVMFTKKKQKQKHTHTHTHRRLILAYLRLNKLAAVNDRFASVIHSHWNTI